MEPTKDEIKEDLEKLKEALKKTEELYQASILRNIKEDKKYVNPPK